MYTYICIYDIVIYIKTNKKPKKKIHMPIFIASHRNHIAPKYLNHIVINIARPLPKQLQIIYYKLRFQIKIVVSLQVSKNPKPVEFLENYLVNKAILFCVI